MARFISSLWPKPGTQLHRDGLLPDRSKSRFQGNRLLAQKSAREWLNTTIDTVQRDDGDVPFHSSLVAFKQLVDGDSYLRTLARDMLREVPNTPPYNLDPLGHCQIRDLDHMLRILNYIISQGPQFYHVQEPPTAMGMIGFPINTLIEWPISTRSGYLFFQDAAVNKHLNDILQTWGSFLTTSASQKCLVESGGWLSQDARNILAAAGNNGETSYTFEQLYECNPDKPAYGFASWDDFFTRRFRPEVRPIDAPDGGPSCIEYPEPTAVIVNSCESATYQYATGVKYSDTFWSKEQPYSLVHMLNHSPLAAQFVGGTVYQAFLSALTYHRWHAPVSGRVVDIQNVAGAYYSTNSHQGFENHGDKFHDPDPLAATLSQAYLSAVAARGIVFVEADNPEIGLMAAVYIGMGEVSSCEFTIKKGQHVRKGQEIGMFHYGGSSHCLLFRPETKLNLIEQKDPSVNRAVNSALAIAGGSVAEELGYEFV